MSHETPNNDPLDFMKGMWGNMGFSLPGMVTPTFDTGELEKRITDLKAVEGWLRMNLSMLQVTIQGLEMQHSTLSAMKAMGQMAAEGRAAADEGQAAEDSAAGSVFTQAAMWPWSMMQQVQTHMQEHAEAAAAESAKTAAAQPAAPQPAEPSAPQTPPPAAKPASGRKSKKQ